MLKSNTRRIIIVCGQTGAGKTTYSIKLSREINAVKFSIDPWMQTLFAKDMVSLNFDWMMERVERCQTQIWEVAEQVIHNNINIVLDLGFTTYEQRAVFINQAKELGITAEVHYINTPLDIRRQRITNRNIEKDPKVYAFDVTEQMLQFMESRFESPSTDELLNGVEVDNATKRKDT